VHGYSLLRPTLNVDYFHELYDQAADFGIEIEGHRKFVFLACPACLVFRWTPVDPVWAEHADTETGPGVFETALAYTEVSRMADNAILFKLLAKSIGVKYGIMPTFMAKPWGDVSGLDRMGEASVRLLTRCSSLDVQGEDTDTDTVGDEFDEARADRSAQTHPRVSAGQEREEPLCGLGRGGKGRWPRQCRVPGHEVHLTGGRVVPRRSPRWAARR
jgi:hypothetical protein